MTPMIIGTDNHRYTWQDGWGQLPDDVTLGYTHGVAVDRQGRVYVHNQSPDAMVVFEGDGTFVGSWGEAFAAGAHGLFYNIEDGEEFFYLSDYERHLVVKTTLAGDEIWRLGLPDRPDIYESEDAYRPTDVAVAPNGDVYIADGYGQSYVHHYTQAGEYVRSWGGSGTEPGQLNQPHGIWVDTRPETPEVLVADRANVRIQVFSLDGEHLRFEAAQHLRFPCDFFITPDNLVYIPDLYGRVTILDEDYELVVHLGDNPGVWERDDYPNIAHDDREPGRFISPHGLCVEDGDIYVVEWVSDGRVTRLERVS